ncbi:DUF742 domain-containing protein [Streptomyces adustus]|uniref:DUF742 domain-containing protein n=1 Tax=Streptomyces adustus TaxID=1609272 RepID=A0A5N8VL02_9ACTN|nr:DUF742 domain-containing protein [Streptomyces adustus]MPY35921.1 DUF742 domain-containing protein [Streptomyces adustus]
MADGAAPPPEPDPDPDAGADPVADPASGPAPVPGSDPAPVPVGPASAVRPFLVTAGRVAGSGEAESGRTMPVETQLVTTVAGLDGLDRLSFERRDIVAACRQPQSIAEIAARLRLHLNVVRVLAEDLRRAGQLSVHVPDAGVTHGASVLRRVIEGLRAIPDSRGILRDTD